MREPRSYAVVCAAGAVALHYSLRLSAGDRGVVDFVVVALAAAAAVVGLVQLGRRLRRSGGGRDLWHLQRTLLFWILGLMNTLWAAPESAGTWRTWVGLLFLLLAVVDTIGVLRREQRALQQDAAAA